MCFETVGGLDRVRPLINAFTAAQKHTSASIASLLKRSRLLWKTLCTFLLVRYLHIDVGYLVPCIYTKEIVCQKHRFRLMIIHFDLKKKIIIIISKLLRTASLVNFQLILVDWIFLRFFASAIIHTRVLSQSWAFPQERSLAQQSVESRKVSPKWTSGLASSASPPQDYKSKRCTKLNFLSAVAKGSPDELTFACFSNAIEAEGGGAIKITTHHFCLSGQYRSSGSFARI